MENNSPWPKNLKRIRFIGVFLTCLKKTRRKLTTGLVSMQIGVYDLSQR